MKKIAVMTGGGDCPGLNAVIRAVVRSGLSYDIETLGIHNGWQGLIEGDLEMLTEASVSRYHIAWAVLSLARHGQIRSKNPAIWKRSEMQ